MPKHKYCANIRYNQEGVDKALYFLGISLPHTLFAENQRQTQGNLQQKGLEYPMAAKLANLAEEVKSLV